MNLTTDVAVIGGGLGGVAAALAVLERGHRVVLTEEYAWLGGQLTSQAVPPDEHIWVEQFGVTARYRALRDGIRRYYRDHYPLSEEARADQTLNPGRGRVSRLCHEPRVAVAVIEQLLAPYRSNGQLVVLQPAKPVAASVVDDVVRSVTVEHGRTGIRTVIEASFVLDATETGDLLPLTGTAYVVGAEARSETGEPSAAAVADPENVQSIAWCFVFDHVDGDHTIPRPVDYDEWKQLELPFWGAPMLSFTAPNPRTLEPEERTLDVNPALDRSGDPRVDAGDTDLWQFRRIAARQTFREGFAPSDIVLANWPQLDYVGGSIIDSTDRESHLAAAKAQSLAYFHWLQTEAPRPDGGYGWPGLRLRGDVIGSDDGFAQAPYIRESRRIRALRTVVEQDISVAHRGHGGPATFDDTVGVGMYRIDLHPSTGGDNYIDVECAPFEIPLGALIPVRTKNLLAAAKNIGTTHITNGAYRLHPVEWNIGESAGELAGFCLEQGHRPHDVAAEAALTAQLQSRLGEVGVEIHWPEIIGY
ncbi:FAD-dependent oxidoreductase [Microbacterium luteolum]|uniref:FAD-dependent oxidoreductase n=1 Tax=Microbacterium luteolum TaxID=69367 RepID=A0ABY7XR77_MICLT|nr:FAD-dependent oxidoreductase [Microbacterium luteolum]WDM44406.1 FAD-dependent oxidoreductase [Microbacterium luteolum]